MKISFITYQYKLIATQVTTKYFDIANIEDIVAMKLSAIQSRAVNKDYVDIYFVIKNNSLDFAIDSYFKKYQSPISKTLLLKYLTAFEDIKNQPLKLTNNISRETIKSGLFKTIQNYLSSQ